MRFDMESIEKVISDLKSIKNLGVDGIPAHIKIDNAIEVILELREYCNKYLEWGMREGYNDGYKKGASDMEKAKQIIIDQLLEQIPKWHLVSEGDLPSEEDYLNSKLCWDEYRERCVFARYCNGTWILGDGKESIKVIAWMELPKFSEVE